MGGRQRPAPGVPVDEAGLSARGPGKDQRSKSSSCGSKRGERVAGTGPRRRFVFLASCLYAAMTALGLCLVFATVAGTWAWGGRAVRGDYAGHLQMSTLSALRSGSGLRPSGVWRRDATSPLSGHVVNELLLYWGLPLALILSALAVSTIPERWLVLEWLRPARAVLGREVPAAWAGRLCGGVSVAEALFLALLALRNVLIGLQTVKEARDGYGALKEISAATGVPLPYGRWYYELNGVALALGVTSFQNLMWLFFPIVRFSPLFDTLGLTFERRIKYHRWLGHFTMATLATHGSLYWILWCGVSGQEWANEALNWADHRRVNNLAGAFSLAFGLALWVTALEWTRRRYFEVFYKAHILCFAGFLTFGILHAPGMHVYLGAGLLLYCLDLVLRLTQRSTPVKVKWSGWTSDMSIAVLGFDTAKPVCPFSTFFVNFESISKSQWYTAIPITMGGGTGMKMCFKNVGKWTSRLVREARAGRLTAARLVGPCGATPDIRSFQEHEYLVMVAGGIDITPLLTLLKNLAMANAKNRRKAEEKSKGAAVGDGAPVLQGRIVVVWTMEKISEVELMDEELFSFSRAHPDELELRIHYAGKSELDDWTGTMVPNEAAKPGIKLDLYDSEREAESGVGFWRTFVQEWIWRLSPTALPQHWGSLHLAVLHVAVFVAAVMGLILGATWHPEASRPGEGAPRGKVELVAISAMLMMAVGMATLGTFPAHLILYAKARRSATPGEPPIPTTLTSTTASWTEWTQDIEWSGLDLESVPVEISDTPVLSPMTIDWLKRNMVEGRPYVDDVLDDVSGKLSAEGTAGVITAGPKAMIDNVKVAVARRTPQFLLKTLQAYEPSEAS